mgnify:CR=1 FL=1
MVPREKVMARNVYERDRMTADEQQLRSDLSRLGSEPAIRKEAYASLPRRTAMSQQYRGSAIDIVYSPESLREIFVNNVRLLKSDQLVEPARARAHPLEAFLGRAGIAPLHGDQRQRQQRIGLLQPEHDGLVVGVGEHQTYTPSGWKLSVGMSG